MIEFTNRIRKVLKQNYIIQNCDDIIPVNYKTSEKSIDLYKKNNYSITPNLSNFLNYFANVRLTFIDDEGADEIHFNTKKILRLYPKHFVDAMQKDFSLKNIVPFALVYTEHMVIFSDENDWTFGAYDNFVALFGYNQIEALDNILIRKTLKEFDFGFKK